MTQASAAQISFIKKLQGTKDYLADPEAYAARKAAQVDGKRSWIFAHSTRTSTPAEMERAWIEYLTVTIPGHAALVTKSTDGLTIAEASELITALKAI